MVARVVPCLVFLDGFGEEEGPPVREAANYATVGEYKGAGRAGDPGEGALLVGKERQLGWSIGAGDGTL